MPLLPLLFACGEFVTLAPGESLDGGVNAVVGGDLDLAGATELRHFGFDSLLRLQTVDGAGPYGGRGVDYGGLNGSAEATGALAAYLAALSTVTPSNLSSPDERLAYWLNAYNAWTLYAVAGKVAENPDYNVESDGWLLFSSKFITVDGMSLSPNDIEHGVIRGWVDQPFGDEALAERAAVWHEELWVDSLPDARLHMGLNCASASCPDVPPGAFQGPRIWDQLDAQAAVFLANPDKGAGPAGVSTLFSWFSDDFTDTFGSVEAFVGSYRPSGDADVTYGTYLAYDWALNEASLPSGEAATCASPW
jgi:hypothetical protein